MEMRMQCLLTRWGAAALVLAALAACGGGNGSDSPPAPPADTALAATIAAAAAVPANDTAINPFAPFTVLQGAGVPAVTIGSPPKVNFTVFSDGAVKTGLTLVDMSFAIAKLVPGSNGNPDEWQNYVSRKATATAAGSPGAAMTPPATAMQATTDPKRTDAELAAAGLGPQLVYNADGYYTYTFSADITNPTWNATINKVAYSTNGVVFDPNATHRIAIQLSYKNAAGEVVRVNPHVAIRFVKNASGGYDAVPLTDPATQDYLMTDVTSCNACHEKLALHGGGRVDTQYCVMCHNPGTTDPDSGNVLNLSTMTHKIHAGRLLASSAGGENYTIWGYGNTKYDYSEVGFPQDLRNCAKCHTSANPSTPQGDNWKVGPVQGSLPDLPRQWRRLDLGKDAQGLRHPARDERAGPDEQPVPRLPPGRHRPRIGHGSLAADRGEQGPLQDEHRERHLQRHGRPQGPHGDGEVLPVQPDRWRQGLQPGDFRLHRHAGSARLREHDEVRQPALLPRLPEHGRAIDRGHRVLGLQQRRQQRERLCLQGPPRGARATTAATTTRRRFPCPTTRPRPRRSARPSSRAPGRSRKRSSRPCRPANPRPPVAPAQTVNTVVQHTTANVVISGALQPRRTIVSDEKCNVCHAALGTASGSNTMTPLNAFHSGARVTVASVLVCHDPNRVSTSVTTNGCSSTSRTSSNG